MIRLRSIFTTIALITGGGAAFAQGYINLNFESANVTGYSVGSSSVPTTNAFPGWQVYYGNTLQSQVWYDGVSLGGNLVSIWDTNREGNTALQGRYSAALFSSMSVSSSISQSASVPAGSDSLIMDIYSSNPGDFSVTLGGQALTLIPLSEVNSSDYPYTIYGADISSFTGLANQQLDITDFAGSQFGGQANEMIVDGIQFSAMAVPEPGELSLSALGGILFYGRRWKILKAKP